MNKTILVVDDDARLRQMLEFNFVQHEFNVVTAIHGRDALLRLQERKIDLIILDLLMPEMDGYSFMRVYPRNPRVPIIILSARIEETDAILGLELGADDYVTKPFSVRELIARVNAQLRRVEALTTMADEEEQPIQTGPITIIPAERTVIVHGEVVHLTHTEFTILHTLMTNLRRVYSRDELIEKTRTDDYDGYVRNIDTHIVNLRRKIEPNPRDPIFIETVYGQGYRGVAPE